MTYITPPRARVGSSRAASEAGQRHRISDRDARAIARDHPALLELRQGARHQLANGADAGRELLLCEGEIHREPGRDPVPGPAGGADDVVRQPLVHRTEGEAFRQVREVPDATRHGLQQRQGHRRVPSEQGDHRRPGNEEGSRGRGGDRGSHVSPPIEQGRLAEGCAGPLRVEHLLSPAGRELTHLDLAFHQEVQAAARLSRREQDLPFPQDALRAVPEKPSPLGRREETEVRRPAERVFLHIAGRSPAFAVPAHACLWPSSPWHDRTTASREAGRR